MFVNCFRRAKIQNLSAIHNIAPTEDPTTQLFQICKDTKFVSNSQLDAAVTYNLFDCFRYAKIQNLSAIHNRRREHSGKQKIVSDMQRYKICQQFTTQLLQI